MKVVLLKKPYPRVWSAAYKGGNAILLEKDIRFHSMYLKLLVFPSYKPFRFFWGHARPTISGGPIGDAAAAVSPLQCSWMDYRKTPWPSPKLEVDPRYFAVMGLVRGHLGMEIITHESVHAAYAYAKRVGSRNPWTPAVDGLDEEMVCYPAGRIARLVVTALNDAGLYDSNRISLNGP